MPHLEISLLGPARFAIDGRELAAFTYAKVRTLLIYLAVEQGRAHSRDSLAELLWPDQAPQVGRSSLRQALAQLRQALGEQAADPPRLLVTRESVAFNPACDHTLDTAAFAALVAPRVGHAHPEAAACPVCLERWASAVDLYRGSFADGPLPRDAQGYEEWLLTRREWYARQQLDTLARLADAHEALGAPGRALAYARRALELDPWREPAHRQVMRLLNGLGERSAALAQYERCRRALASELGVEPEEETLLLYEALKREQVARLPGDRASGALAQPTPEGPAFAEPSPDRPIAEASGQLLATLPAQPTSFIGRVSELRDLEALLARPTCRLLTLLGPGGIGKTRLALQLAERVASDFRDGICWAALAPLRSRDELARALARLLGRPSDDAAESEAALREAVAQRHMLLILDNLEQLSDGIELIADLLAAGPQLRVLATSRERLRLRAEWVYDVGGLAYPRPDDPLDHEYDAVRLLVERASQVGQQSADQPADREAVAWIARTVEGHPLALELAAAASRSRSFATIATAIETDIDLLRVTLRDVPPRHRSVRAAIEYSWRLLEPAERHAVARLSVFRGGISPAAALAVAAADEDLLETLADKSMLRRANGRYELHELLRRFAAEQLVGLGLALVTREAHLGWCVSMAEAAEPLIGGAEQERWLGELEADHANIRAALAWAIEQAQAEPALRLSAALMRFWWIHGHLREGRQWLERAIGLAGGSSAARARALHGAGGIASQMGDLHNGRLLMEQSLELERAVGRKHELTRVLNNLAFTCISLAEYEQATAMITEALALDRELGDERGVAFDLGTLGQLAYFQRDYAQAIEHFGASLAGHRKAGDTHSIAIMLLNLGSARRLQGHPRAARADLSEGMALLRELGSAYGVALALTQLARLSYDSGDRAAARAELAECLPQLAALGTTGELAAALALTARLALDAGATQRSAQLWSASMRLLDERSASLQPPEMLEYGLQLAEARAQAEPTAWATGWAEGRSLSLHEAVELGLSTIAQAEG